MQFRSAKDSVIILKKILQSLLINQLGKYILSNNTEVPSIAIRQLGNTNAPIYKIKPSSGVECIIEPEPETEFRPLKFSAVHLVRRFRIILDQHDATKTLTDSLELIYSHPGVKPMEQPIVRQRLQMLNQQGETPSRAMFYVSDSQYLQSLF